MQLGTAMHGYGFPIMPHFVQKQRDKGDLIDQNIAP